MRGLVFVTGYVMVIVNIIVAIISFYRSDILIAVGYLFLAGALIYAIQRSINKNIADSE